MHRSGAGPRSRAARRSHRAKPGRGGPNPGAGCLPPRPSASRPATNPSASRPDGAAARGPAGRPDRLRPVGPGRGRDCHWRWRPAWLQQLDPPGPQRRRPALGRPGDRAGPTPTDPVPDCHRGGRAAGCRRCRRQRSRPPAAAAQAGPEHTERSGQHANRVDPQRPWDRRSQAPPAPCHRAESGPAAGHWCPDPRPCRGAQRHGPWGDLLVEADGQGCLACQGIWPGRADLNLRQRRAPQWPA